jgi:hypothetical protein
VTSYGAQQDASTRIAGLHECKVIADAEYMFTICMCLGKRVVQCLSRFIRLSHRGIQEYVTWPRDPSSLAYWRMWVGVAEYQIVVASFVWWDKMTPDIFT